MRPATTTGPTITAALVSTTPDRHGIAAKVVRAMPLACSDVATRTPRATNAIWPMYTPPRLLRTTSSSPQPGLPGTHPGDAPPVSTAEQTNSPKAMVDATPARSSQAVLGPDRSSD